MPIFRFFFFFLLLLSCSLVGAQKSKAANTTWLTLSGNAPRVIAKGGASGLFPDSSILSYVASATNVPNAFLWCDVQLTKDRSGICAPALSLDNCTNIGLVFPANKTTYLVNGVATGGYFSVDYTVKDLENVSLTQGIFSRPFQFDSLFAISTVEQVVEQVARNVKLPGFWLNIQYDLFFSQHNLSMRSFVVSVSRRVIINYISSPEVGFLSSIAKRFNASRTKLIFRFLGTDDMEPSTNQTYGSLLKNLTFIKTFASGILIPKHYIWPVDSNQYLLPHTSVVLDAHKEGLEVYASEFVNDDGRLSYNYSYDPLAESLNYIDNGDFSVDGILTDFPVTPSEAVGCFAHINNNGSEDAKLIIISHNGASGIYPGCTDLAYQQAIADGANVIDCSVQITRDGEPVCLSSINLVDSTTILQSSYSSRLSSIPEINGGARGIFSFNLTWSEIKESVKPLMSNPFSESKLQRNPAYTNAGSLMTLAEFLKFAVDKPISGILINIENAVYLAEKQGVSVTDSVLDALRKAGYENQTLGVTIQSTNISVLNKFKLQSKYKCMYLLDESIHDADTSSIEDIKRSADSVAIKKSSIYPLNKAFIVDSTGLVTKLKSFGLTVYAYYFRNEFISQAWDFLSDPTVEINSYFQGAGVDGIITEFPATASRYKRNACLKMGKQMPKYMNPVLPGGLLQVLQQVGSFSLPPAQAPVPPLTYSDVYEPPLPAVSVNSPGPIAGGNATNAPTSSPSNGQPRNTVACVFMSLIMLLGSLFLI